MGPYCQGFRTWILLAGNIHLPPGDLNVEFEAGIWPAAAARVLRHEDFTSQSRP